MTINYVAVIVLFTHGMLILLMNVSCNVVIDFS
jgi:hypothetical protein